MTSLNPHLRNRNRKRRSSVQVSTSTVGGTPLYQTERCALCPELMPNLPARPGRHKHHVRPLEYGGADDGDKVTLCASCHDELHRMASVVWRGKIQCEDIPSRRLRFYVSELIDQRRRFDAGETEAPDARRRISVSLTADELVQAHQIKKHYGHSSLEAMMLALLREAAYKMASGR